MQQKDVRELHWMLQFERNPYPKNIDWEITSSSEARFYWLGLYKDDLKPGLIINASLGENAIVIEASDEASVDIYLNDTMVNLDKAIQIENNGNTIFSAKAPRTLEIIKASIESLGDPSQMFVSKIHVHISASKNGFLKNGDSPICKQGLNSTPSTCRFHLCDSATNTLSAQCLNSEGTRIVSELKLPCAGETHNCEGYLTCGQCSEWTPIQIVNCTSANLRKTTGDIRGDCPLWSEANIANCKLPLFSCEGKIQCGLCSTYKANLSGSYLRSCKHTKITTDQLTSECQSAKGYQKSTLDLPCSSDINNCEGLLKCGSC
jgi:hypothetical protein